MNLDVFLFGLCRWGHEANENEDAGWNERCPTHECHGWKATRPFPADAANATPTTANEGK